MHALQPKHTKLSKDESEKLLKKFNVSLSQLPKISKKDPALPSNVSIEEGDIFRIERKSISNDNEGKSEIEEYYRVVV